ncbi:MAG TPA: hypothetical protein VF790_09690 [Dissulfurispiraceae bacterium]
MHAGEAINVIASFGPAYRIRPVRFRWSGRLFDVKEVTYSWKSREGQKIIYHFSVTDGKTLYELTFDTHSLLWKVENLEV